jgi:hypothetical protein
MIRFLTYQYRYACRVGFSRRDAIIRALRTYMRGF